MKHTHCTGGGGNGAQRFQVVLGRVRRQPADNRDLIFAGFADEVPDGDADHGEIGDVRREVKLN